MALTQMEIENVRQRAERIARREFDRYDRRENIAVEDPDTNRKMMLKKRMKWRSKFNVLGLLLIGGCFSVFILSIDAGTSEHSTPVVSETDIQSSKPGPILTEKRNVKTGSSTSYVDRSFWQTDFVDTAQREMNPWHAFLDGLLHPVILKN